MSVVLAGSPDHLRVAQSDLTAAPLTIMAWTKPTYDTMNESPISVDIYESATHKILGAIEMSGNVAGDPVRAFTYSGTYAIATTTNPFVAGVWNHVAAVFSSDSSRDVFIDGGGKGSNTDSKVGDANEYIVGARRGQSPLAWFYGKISHVAVWNIALSDAEIAQLASGVDPRSVQLAHLLHYWPLAGDPNDIVGSTDLVAYGAPTYDTSDQPDFNSKKLYSLPTWTQLEDCPEPKDQFGFAECNGLLYAVCGVTTGDAHSKKAYAFDPDTGHWSAIADAPRVLQSPILESVNGKLYLIGGYNSYLGTHYNNVTEYDPDTDTWTEKTVMPQAVEDHGSAVIDNEIWIFGGLYNNLPYLIRPYIDVYNPITDTWRTPSISWATPRCLGDFCCEYNGKVYIISATTDMSGYSAHVNATTSVQRYNPDADTFDEMAPVPVVRTYHSVKELNGLLYTVGGRYDAPGDVLQTQLTYDVAFNKWSSVKPPFLVALSGLAGVGLVEYGNKIYICGGRQEDGTSYTYTAGLYSFSPVLVYGSGSGTLSKGVVPPVVESTFRFNAFNYQLDIDRS